MQQLAADLLKAARASAGLTQRTLAQRAGVPQPTIAAIETGRRQPTVALLGRVLAAADRHLMLSANYRPMTLAELARHVAGADEESTRFRLVLEFLDEYRAEPESSRDQLVVERPSWTGSAQWDAMLGALAEHCAVHDGYRVPEWAFEPSRYLGVSWYPTNLPTVRAAAIAHSPAAFRVRGIFIDDQELASV